MTSILNFFKFVTILVVLSSSFIIVNSSFVFAQGGGVDSGQGASQGGVDNGVAPSVSLESPLKNIDSIEGLLVAILNIIIILMIPVIVFFIILAGFKYVTAQGNASQVEDATRSLTYAIIGGVLILAAVAISQIIANVVDSF